MNWRSLKKSSEFKWNESEVYSNVYGYQIQPGTMWNAGLTESEILSFEKIIGLVLPTPYKEMLSEINGFDRDSVNVHGSEKPETYSRNCYKYPEDFKSVKWILEEIEENKKYVAEALEEASFNFKDVEGYIPLFGHRALVVFRDKALSPVISIVGDDVIVYGSTLEEYWNNEFKL
jgi:SMI1 / KNR4 family (SUKH-1)